MTYKCDWPGCSATTDNRIGDGWQWGDYEPDLLPKGMPSCAIVCELHKRAYEALEWGPPSEAKN
jgi:hypothetical protein